MLLHPLDFLGKEDVPELAFFPGMSLSSHRKLIILNKFLAMLKREFSVVPMGQHAELIVGAGALPLLEPPDRAPVANPAF
jgi:peptidoglycan-N-acetylglucosamine deacetylase